MHAIVGTSTEGFHLYIYRVADDAALIVARDDMEGDVGYLNGQGIVETMLALGHIYNEIHTDRKASVSFEILDGE